MKTYSSSFFKRINLTLVLASVAIVVPTQTIVSQTSAARIKIDTERTVGEIDKKIYGNFVEHLGRCIYGGLYEPGSSLSDKDGFREDVITATKELNVPIVRWPGGNFVSGYRWEDGIGPKNQRPTRIDLAWGYRENNSFGTDEFIDWCRKAHTEPYFCVNMGTGSLDEARNWVEYCNIEKGTYYSDLRIKNGHPEPHKVIYWGLGNEMDGPWQMGHKSAEDYGKFALEAAKLMKWIDKDIKLVAAGSSNYGSDWTAWNRTVLNYLKDHIDYIALHNYVGNHGNNYYEFMASTIFAEKAIHITEGTIREVMSKTRRQTPIYIAFDEYNVWYRARGEEGNEEIYNLEDALVVASYLNIFVRNAHIVKMANLAQLVNVIAPIFTSTEGSWRQTIFYPLAVFANHCYGESLQTFVDCASYKQGQEEIPYLDVSSAYNKETKEIILNVVNRHKDNAITTDIFSQQGKFNGTATIYEVNGKDIKDENSADKQTVKTSNKTQKVNGEEITYSFPPHSYTMIIVPIGDK
ncbi:alpha-N-arabinofuranosidase [Bacteroidia bacterium]|nr:alpha-N-arabinofuranosidase [Bacteroidia bacterium]